MDFHSTAAGRTGPGGGYQRNSALGFLSLSGKRGGSGRSYGINNHSAASLSGNLGFSSHKKTVDTSPNDYSENAKTSSWGIRGGLDAYFQVSDKFVIFAGPGVRYSRSKVKLDVENTDESTSGWDNPRFSSLSLSGRLGGMINLAQSFGIYGSFGQQFCYSWFDVNSGGQTRPGNCGTRPGTPAWVWQFTLGERCSIG